MGNANVRTYPRNRIEPLEDRVRSLNITVGILKYAALSPFLEVLKRCNSFYLLNF
jgi:hypothetical protein